ncbi:hypothetical protein CASFOL_022202 [Castilleja foliolosa]|uniref:PPIase cyclophilin-type domain-containing protein n=1 Tax=Castilleja foliolosa TaxID=1961234 RepID=A0ABD3CTZ5_9LAMI
MEQKNKNKVLVFLDVSVDGDPLERMIFELFNDVAPRTAENFRALCTGEKGISLKTGKPLHYKGTFFHHIIKGHVAEAGDFLRQNGNYGESIYGGKFPVLVKCRYESPKLKHDGPGLLSMAIADRDEKGSLFAVTFKADHRLDRKRVVFGKLVDGYEVLKKIENAGDDKGIPAVLVKIVNSGEIHAVPDMPEKKRDNKLKMGKDATEENNHEVKRKSKHKKSSRKKRKRRRYYTSESDSSTDTDSDSSESDTDSDSESSSSSDTSSSSDDRRKKRKRSKRDKHRRGKKDRRHEKRRKKRDKKSKRKSKRDSVSDSETGNSSEDVAVGSLDVKHKPSSNQAPLVDRENENFNHKKGEVADMSEREEGEFARENGDHQNNNIGVRMDFDRSADKRPDVVDDTASKSRSGSLSPIRTKSMSISPRTAARSPDIVAKHNRSRSPSASRSPFRSRSITPTRSEYSKSPVRSTRERSVSMSPPFRRSRSRSATRSPPRKRGPRSPPRAMSKRSSFSRSPVKPSRRSISRSPVRSSRKSISRSSGRGPLRKSPSRSPVRPSRRGYRPSSGSPVSAGRRARSPVPVRGKSSSRSPSVDGSPKRIRRGRGFSERFSYVRRFRSQSRSPSPVRPRYGGRIDRDRYSSYRRSPPRRYRSPPRGRTPPRYRGRRSRSRSLSISRSPIRYRGRRYSKSRSPARSRSPADKLHSSPRAVKRRSPSRSGTRSLSPPPRSSLSPRRTAAFKGRSRSSSGSPPPRKANLVSYGDGSPESGHD